MSQKIVREYENEDKIATEILKSPLFWQIMASKLWIQVFFNLIINIARNSEQEKQKRMASTATFSACEKKQKKTNFFNFEKSKSIKSLTTFEINLQNNKQGLSKNKKISQKAN